MIQRHYDRVLQKFVPGEYLSGTKTFIRHITSLSFFFILARVFSLIAGVVCANVLTETEFGTASLVVTVGVFMASLTTIGMGPAIVRYGAPSKNPEQFISAGTWASLIASFIFTLVALVFYRSLARLVEVRPDVLIIGVLSGGLFSIFAIIAAAQQALSRFKLRGAMEVTLAAGYFIMLLLFLFSGWRTWETISFAWIFAYIIALFIGIVPIRKYFAFGCNNEIFKHMLPYALPNLGCAIGFFFSSQIQRLELNALMSEREVAIYTVYYMASVNLATFVWGMVSTVFFNKAATTNNRENLWNITARAGKIGIIPIFLIIFVATCTYILFCGKKYPIDLLLAILFSSAAAVSAVASALGQVISAHGVKAMRLGLVMSLTMGGITTVGTWVMIKYWGLGVYATPVAILIAYLLNIVWLTVVRKQFFN